MLRYWENLSVIRALVQSVYRLKLIRAQGLWAAIETGADQLCISLVLVNSASASRYSRNSAVLPHQHMPFLLCQHNVCAVQGIAIT